jgi:hypothetical protein
LQNKFRWLTVDYLMRFRCLPKDSLEPNPIDMFFGRMKAQLRKALHNCSPPPAAPARLPASSSPA